MSEKSQSEFYELQKKSSATTLSDMELFIFPELIYSLLLANIMSPLLWRWRDDPWFKGIERKSPAARISRLKQYIMDHYSFNLDLDTWGLTTKERELARFSDFIDTKTLAQSNALFGYEGDKYYFDIDIRSHFNLDKYTSNVIPYWKTETVEAMTAFSRREGYQAGAGECVSLAALYAAALFVVLGIPLKDIYMMATPLHSQNFLDVSDGILTNNRRIVTRNMWFNGTALSAQARRALEHERITLVAHETGTIHVMYPEATISPEAYENFRTKLNRFLSIALTPEMLGNFLRQAPECHKCILVRKMINGVNMYIPLARAFEYERDSSYKVTDNTRDKLFDEMEQAEFAPRQCVRCLVLNDLEDYIRESPVDILNGSDTARLIERFKTSCMDAEMTVTKLIEFCHVVPRMPDAAVKHFQSGQTPLGIKVGMNREEIISHVEALRDENEYCRFAFYAWRDLSRTEIEPFLLAAVERNPVCIEKSAEGFPDEAALVKHVETMSGASIYEGESRLAQPDEVWNFATGDGLERAIMLGVILHARNNQSYSVDASSGEVSVKREDGSEVTRLASAKVIRDNIIRIR